MKRTLSLVLSWIILLMLLLPCAASAESRAVLTIGDITDRSGARISGENQLGVWRYLEDQLGVEIRYVYLSPQEYNSGASCNPVSYKQTDREFLFRRKRR